MSRCHVRVLVVSIIAALTTIASPGAASAGGDVRLRKVAEVDTPTALAVRPDDDTLYVAEQGGRVVAVRNRKVARRPVLDISDRVTAGGEQGLLGLTFSPDGSRLYVHFSDPDGDTRVEQFEFSANKGGGGRAVVSTRREILRVDQPQANHNGGEMTFGPDGMLYLGLGDGGSGGDEGEGHARGGNGQSLDTLLGKILRVDPTLSGDEPYTIPDDNPFADGGGGPEIWAYGLRNPWRFSFDEPSGTIWIADVGQDEWEEIDVAPADEDGINYGWNVFEGKHRYRDGRAPEHVPPIVEESHDDGNCSITGGYVYRGDAIGDLDGWYVYSDYCNGELRAVKRDGDDIEQRSLGVSSSSIAAFGRDNDGELYVLSQEEGLLEIVPA